MSWGGIFGGAFGFASSMMSVKNQQRENAIDRDFQREMYDLSVKNNREDATTAHERQKELTNLQAQLSYENEQNIEKNRVGNTLESAKNAGVNPALAMGVGAGGNAAGGVATPTPTKAEAGHAPMASSHAIPPIQASLDLSTAMMQEAMADKNKAEAENIRESTKTEKSTRQGKIDKLHGDYQVAMARANESSALIAKYASETALNNAKTTWQNIQNIVSYETLQTQIDTVKQELNNLKKSYDQMASVMRLNNSKTGLNRAQIPWANKYWKNLVENLGAETQLLGEKTNNETWQGLFNGLSYDIESSLKQWHIYAGEAAAKQQMAWKEMFEARIRAQLRGQNIEMFKTIAGGLLDVGGMLLLKKPTSFGVGRGVQKQIKYEWNGRGFTPRTATKSYWE